MQARLPALVTSMLAVLPHAQTGPDTLGIDIHAEGAFSVAQASAGDTVEYVIAVEWKDSRVPVVVLAPDSMSTPDFRVAGQNAAHKKSARGEVVLNRTEFTYRLVPTLPGNARVAPLKLRYMTGLSNNQEALYVPAAALDVLPASVSIWNRVWFRMIALLLLAGGTGWALWRGLAAVKKNRRAKAAGRDRDFTPEVKALRGRWNAADSKKWIEDAEAVCLAFLRHSLKVGSSENSRLEPLLEKYLQSQSLTPAESEGWARLRELFHHAHYAGGHKEPYELQESHRILKTCLHIQGDET